MKIKEMPIKNLPKKGYCEQCDDLVSFHVECFSNQTHRVKDIDVTADEYIGICDKCGTHLFIDPIEDYNCKTYFDEYRKKAGLLTSKEIKAIRKKRGMSQRDLALFLSIGEKDIARYESGAIQTRAIDLMIRMVDDDQIFKKMSRVIEKTRLIASKSAA